MSENVPSQQPDATTTTATEDFTQGTPNYVAKTTRPICANELGAYFSLFKRKILTSSGLPSAINSLMVGESLLQPTSQQSVEFNDYQSTAGQEESAVVFWWNRPPTHETKQVCTGIEEDYLGNSVSMNLPDVRHMTDESLAPFHRNRGRLPRKPRQHESSSKASTGSPESKEIASETASA
ncbi:unnamed protein product [Protopolystoma xenopodis]|uniref:Uncharacterized protein n=1 Tax=Protopolystoma xenopodis TaxID=117903 RepID=A0A448XMQ8_9PLAT|nr:unnamed protein product [Protopolystoma xenopodis]